MADQETPAEASAAAVENEQPELSAPDPQAARLARATAKLLAPSSPGTVVVARQPKGSDVLVQPDEDGPHHVVLCRGPSRMAYEGVLYDASAIDSRGDYDQLAKSLSIYTPYVVRGEGGDAAHNRVSQVWARGGRLKMPWAVAAAVQEVPLSVGARVRITLTTADGLRGTTSPLCEANE